MRKNNFENLETLFDEIPIAIFDLTIDSNSYKIKFNYLNSTAEQFFKDILISGNLNQDFTLNDLLISTTQLTSAMNNLKEVGVKKRIVIKNREYLLKNKKEEEILLESSMVLEAMQKDISVRGIFSQKSQIVKSEIPISKLDYYKAIEEEINNLKDFFNKFDALVMILDKEFEILFISPNIDDEILYRPRKEVLNKKLSEIFPEGQAKFFETHIQEAFIKKQYIDFEYHLPIENKMRWFQCRILPVLTKEQIVAIIRDITKWRLKPI